MRTGYAESTQIDRNVTFGPVVSNAVLREKSEDYPFMACVIGDAESKCVFTSPEWWTPNTRAKAGVGLVLHLRSKAVFMT
jgi:hypothetical protein